MIFSPSHTPEFSAVENVFADLKRQLGTYQFDNTKDTAEEMAKILFAYKPYQVKAFYKKVFRNILDFWRKTNMEKVRELYA